MDCRGRSSVESWSSQTWGWKMAHHTYRPRVQFYFAHAVKCRSQGKSFHGPSMLLLLHMSNDCLFIASLEIRVEFFAMRKLPNLRHTEVCLYIIICASNCETGQMEEHKCDSNMGIEAESKASS